MNVSKAVIATLQQLDEQLFQSLEEYVTSLELKRAEWVASIEKDFDEYEKTGILPINLAELDKLEVPQMNEPDASKFSTNSALSSSKKDNSIPTASKRVRMTRQMKKSNEVVKPNVVKILKHIEVKEEMPHPSNENVRSTRKKKPTEASITIKSERLDEHLKSQEDNRDSDVQIQKQIVETIVLEDSILVPELEQIRTTRARTKRLHKDHKSESTESESNRTTRKKSTELEQNDKNNYNNSLKQPVPRRETSKRKADDFNDLDVEDTSSSVGTNESNNNVNKTQIVNKPILINTIVVTNPAQPSIRTTRANRNKKKSSEPAQNVLQNDKDNNDSPYKQSLTTKSATIDLKESTTIKVDEFNDLNTENTSTPIVTNELSTNVNEIEIICKPTVMNATMAVTNPTQTTLKLITSDDEDVVSDSPPRSKRQKITKAVFSPYDQSPVKKKIAVFEQLGSNSKLPVSTFKENFSDNDLRKNMFQIKTKEISKLFGTPLRDNLQASSASKLHSNTPTSSLTSLTSNKAATGLKTFASKTEFRERELRKKQKESDALQKKEALILAQIEEKRKKREEREMKVQQVKIAMEKDKQRQLETAEKAKNEKLKQVEAEKEAKNMKQKEELAKKRAAAFKRAQEAKQKEQINNKKYIPPYLQYETPILPTPDCYDSDDSTRKQKINFPLWQMKPQITQAQHCMRNLEPLKKTFFFSGPRTPDLLQIFPSIQPSKLKRTSSAIWNKTEISILFENISEDED